MEKQYLHWAYRTQYKRHIHTHMSSLPHEVDARTPHRQVIRNKWHCIHCQTICNASWQAELLVNGIQSHLVSHMYGVMRPCDSELARRTSVWAASGHRDAGLFDLTAHSIYSKKCVCPPNPHPHPSPKKSSRSRMMFQSIESPQGCPN